MTGRVASARLRALSGAHAMALRARIGTLAHREAEVFLGQCRADLPEGDPVLQLACDFAARMRAHGRDAVAVAKVGSDVQRQVARLLWPAPTDRVDLHG